MKFATRQFDRKFYYVLLVSRTSHKCTVSKPYFTSYFLDPSISSGTYACMDWSPSMLMLINFFQCTSLIVTAFHNLSRISSAVA
jgi:hypothetical protein